MVRIKRTISFCPDPSETQPHLVPDHISVSRTRNALAHKTKLGVIMHQFVFAGEYKSLSPLCFRFADHMIQQSSRTDLQEIVKIEAECFPAAEAATKVSIAERLAVYPNHFWVQLDGDRMIGFVNGMVTDDPDLRD